MTDHQPTPEDSQTAAADIFTQNALSRSYNGLRTMIGYFARSSMHYLESGMEDRAEVSFQNLRNLFDDFWEIFTPQHKQIDGNDLVNVLKAALTLGSYEFFEEACIYHAKAVPISFFIWAKEWIKDSHDSEDFDSCLEEGYVLHSAHGKGATQANDSTPLDLLPLSRNILCLSCWKPSRISPRSLMNLAGPPTYVTESRRGRRRTSRMA